MISGCDISGHQGPDWVPDDDHEFVFVKSTEGRTYTSKDAPAQLKTARARNLQIGHYHFMWPGNAVDQARYFVQQTDIRPGDLLVCDWETTRDGHPSVTDAADFIAEVKRLRPGYRVGAYVNRSDWLSTTVKPGDFLFIAQWTTAAEPGIASVWHFWQYTDSPYDLDKAHFDSLDSLKAWANGGRYSVDYQVGYEGWKGTQEWVTTKDLEILLAVEREIKPYFGPIRISQGGLSMGSLSAYTHAGLGAFDVSVRNPFTVENDYHDLATVLKAAATFNRAGLLAFIRGYEIGTYDDKWDDDRHLHVVSWESYDSLHYQAKNQIREYVKWLAGDPDGDGLTSVQQYPGLKIPNLEHWETSPYRPENVTADTARYVVDTDTLNGRDVDGNVIKKRTRGYVITAAKRVQRWGRSNVVTASGTYYSAQYLKPAA